ncbi:rhodanese-like domain-containing protein [Chloroherpeton thalassium]|nr:rhodanese-like domain-containing protein [Chloroherpeton thalassium]
MLNFLLKHLRSLELVEQFVENAHPACTSLEHHTLFELMQSSALETLRIFDVRAFQEFEISHLEQAISVPPETEVSHFFETFENELSGKKLVFYCSVGLRSAEFIGKVQNKCLNAGALSVHNLKGGIFRWYNAGLPVVSANGKTDELHPYNSFWELLVEKRAQ